MSKELFKEAIADAKAVREAALANAKAALEEALAPKLQSMLAAKLQEMDTEELDEVEDKEEVEEGFMPDVTGDLGQDAERAKGFALEEGDEEDLEESFDLSEILAELSEGDDKDADDMNEAEEEEAEEEVEVEDEESEDEMESEGDKITDLTVDELKDIIKDIISAEMESSDMEMGADDMEMGDEEEMSMDMGGEEGGEEIEIAGDEEIAEEEEIDEIDLEELLAELDSLDEADDKEEMDEAKKKEDKEDKEDMKEAIDTINTLRNELNEVNLLNAKLLYVNKIFKAKNLTESQKLKVIAQFDKATTTTEAKSIFESMNNAIAKSAKSTIKESLGFASKAAGIAPQKQIVEVNETVSRWQMLAGIK
jgi:flagellar biosynthesis/type III secretory pathway chaperone